jgi:uncharacterized protein
MLPDRIETSPADASPEAAPQPIQREVFWDYFDLLLVIGFIAAAIVCAGVLHLLLVPSQFGSQPAPADLWLEFVFYAVVFGGLAGIFKLRYRAPVLASLAWKRSRFHPALAGGLGLVLALFLSALGQLVHTPENHLMDELVNSWGSFVLFAITAILVAPAFEELLFRGFLQPLLSRTFGVVAGVLVTAALFGALHLFQYSLAWQYAFIIFLAGAAFGWARVRTGSVIPGTLMHSCFNTASVIAYALSAHQRFK